MLIQFIDSTYYSCITLDSNLLELYSKNDARLLLFFKYNFLLYSLYGLIDSEPSIWSRQNTTDIDYLYYFSLVTINNEVTVSVDKILATIELHIRSDNQLLSLEEISGIICAVWWCAFNLTLGRTSGVLYDCILWASGMHANYCSSIIDRFIHEAPKIICKTNDSEGEVAKCRQKNVEKQNVDKKKRRHGKFLLSTFFFVDILLFDIFLSTFCYFTGFLKQRDISPALLKASLVTEGEYLINQNIEMAFCALQIIACMEHESLVNFFARPTDKTSCKMLKYRNEVAFEIFREWAMDDLTTGVKTCECQEEKSI
jgi:hypothetical protein